MSACYLPNRAVYFSISHLWQSISGKRDQKIRVKENIYVYVYIQEGWSGDTATTFGSV